MLALETDRLFLKQLPAEMAAAVARFKLSHRERMRTREPRSLDEYYTENYWRQKLPEWIEASKQDRSYYFFLVTKAANEIIGTLSFTNVVRGPFQACNVGYFLSNTFEGQGYMTEALRRAIAFMFEEKNFHRLEAAYMLDNDRSARVLERLDFQKEGIAKDYLLINGQWEDMVLTSLVNASWKSLDGQDGRDPSLRSG
jgi:[ribosomal protein S5]-alanine N-acetyltransferase